MVASLEQSAAATRRPRSKKVEADPLVEMQKALFRAVSIEQNGIRKSIYAIEAYFRRLAIDAASGNTAAMWELNKLRDYMERFGLAKAALVPPSPLAQRLDREERAMNTMRDLVIEIRSTTFLELRPAFRRAYERERGHVLPGFEDLLIKDIDISPAAQAVYALKYRRAAARPGVEVGYCRPPVEHQFKKGRSGNPSGRKKPAAENVYDLFRTSILQELFIKSGGRQSASSAIGAGCAQLLANATNGKIGARRALRAIIVVLGDRDMLKPPAPLRPRARLKTSGAEYDELLELMVGAIHAVRKMTKNEMVSAYAERYGALGEDLLGAESSEDLEDGLVGPG